MTISALIVDDQEDFRLLATLVLKRDGAGVSLAGEAKNGGDALAAMETFPVDVVVLDEMMPDMNGLETAQLIRERNPNVGIVLCSAHVDREVREAAAAAGVDICLAKEHVARLPDAIRQAAELAAA